MSAHAATPAARQGSGMARQPGDFPTPTPPLGGRGGVGKSHPPAPPPSSDRDAQRQAVRGAMPEGMRTFCDECRDLLDARLTHLNAETLTIGQPSDPGFPLDQMVIGDVVLTQKGGRRC